MIKNKISLSLIVFVILMVSCKAKQSITESVSVDSISSAISDIISDETYTIEICYPDNNMTSNNNIPENLNSNINDPPKNKKMLSSSKRPYMLPIIPGTKLKISASKNQKQTLQKNIAYSNQAKKDVIADKNKKNERQHVIFIVVLIFFICLSVRYSKKVREKFGR